MASRVPNISDGFESLMRLTTTELADGWLKTVVSPAAMLKVAQLSWAICDVVMVMVEPLCEADAVPDSTVMPVGLASA